MTDYWLSRLFFDLQNPAAAAQYRTDREQVLSKYPLEEPVKQALLAGDVPYLAKLTNPYLLRYYFFSVGMKDDEFMRRLNGG